VNANVLLVSGDLMFWSRVRDAAVRIGRSVSRVDDETGMEEAFRSGGVAKILVDLEVRGLDPLDWAARWKARPDCPLLVAYGSHVDGDRLEAAEKAGFDLVLPRSRFHRSVEELLRA
jgi:DNA-binding response OmpR family regulator